MKVIVSTCLALSVHVLFYAGFGVVPIEQKRPQKIEVTTPSTVTTVAVMQFTQRVEVPAEPAAAPASLPEPISEPEPIVTPEPKNTLNPTQIEPKESEPISSVSQERPKPSLVNEVQNHPRAEVTRTAVATNAVTMSTALTNTKSTGPTKPTRPLSTSGKRAQRRYLGDLMAWLADHQEYPSALKKKHIEGVVHVRFTVAKDGRVTDMSIVESSGYPELDDAALAVLRRANPVPKFPRKLKREQMSLTLPIEFSLITE